MESKSTDSSQNQITQTMLDRWTIANYLVKSESLPTSFKTAATIMVALQTGAEMGLEPMQSLNGLYCVNNKISIWGSTQVYLLRKHGWKIKIGNHTTESCEVTIDKDDESYTYTSTKSDVVRGKAYGIAPKEKLFYHAVSRLIKFYVTEVMGGIPLYNEAEIVEVEPNESTTTIDSKPTIDPLIDFIQNRVNTIEGLESIQFQAVSVEQKEAYDVKLNQLKPKLVHLQPLLESDELFEDLKTNQVTNV